MTYCKNKGTGWHLMTNAEWALLGALGIKTGFQPRGNTYWGQHHEAKHETGTLAPGASELGVSNDDLHGRHADRFRPCELAARQHSCGYRGPCG